jgi:hypothetical protein
MRMQARSSQRDWTRQVLAHMSRLIRWLALVAVIVGQLASLHIPVAAQAGKGTTATIDTCATPTPFAGGTPPSLFLPMVTTSNSGADAAAASSELGMRVAFIHGQETTSALAYLELMAGAGIFTALLPATMVSEADFGQCDLIVVGADSGEWSDGAAKMPFFTPT